jgi:hypothetical protein
MYKDYELLLEKYESKVHEEIEKKLKSFKKGKIKLADV